MHCDLLQCLISWLLASCHQFIPHLPSCCVSTQPNPILCGIIGNRSACFPRQVDVVFFSKQITRSFASYSRWNFNWQFASRTQKEIAIWKFVVSEDSASCIAKFAMLLRVLQNLKNLWCLHGNSLKCIKEIHIFFWTKLNHRNICFVRRCSRWHL